MLIILNYFCKTISIFFFSEDLAHFIWFKYAYSCLQFVLVYFGIGEIRISHFLQIIQSSNRSRQHFLFSSTSKRAQFITPTRLGQ
jgi:hypothetical protein